MISARIVTCLLLSTICVGCIGDARAIRCSPSGTGVWTMDDGVNVTCEMIQKEIDLAFTTLSDDGLVTDVDTLSAFVSVDVHVKDTINFTAGPFNDPYDERLGEYNTLPAPNIVMGKTRISLLHELLHAWDMKHLAVGTSWHSGWDTNGYQAADDDYVERLHRMWTDDGYDIRGQLGPTPW